MRGPIRRRLPLYAVAAGAALLFGAARVLSNGTCNYSITGGSVSFSAPSSGACFTQGSAVSPSASFVLDWRVGSITPSSEAKCDTSATWDQTGSSNDPGASCGLDASSTDNISNASVGSTGSFSRPRSWNCSGGALGNWSVSGNAKQSGTSYGSASRSYWVKTTCP